MSAADEAIIDAGLKFEDEILKYRSVVLNLT
jgi:hypothetical protein